MKDKSDNKIDAAIDEVMESKRLKQASFAIVKLLRLLSLLAVPVFGLIA